MTDIEGGAPPVHPSLSGHSGQWGLASILLGAIVLFLFPLILAMEWLGMYATNNMDPGLLKSEHIDMAVLTSYSVVGAVFLGAGLSVLSALVGLRYAFGRGQPAGLPLGGLVVGVMAVILALVLLYATNEGVTWSRDFQKNHLGKPKHAHVEVVPTQRQG